MARRSLVSVVIIMPAFAEGYRRAYGKDGTLGSEFADWSDEASWPDE